jgi:hypothetical protein
MKSSGARASILRTSFAAFAANPAPDLPSGRRVARDQHSGYPLLEENSAILVLTVNDRVIINDFRDNSDRSQFTFAAFQH